MTNLERFCFIALVLILCGGLAIYRAAWRAAKADAESWKQKAAAGWKDVVPMPADRKARTADVVMASVASYPRPMGATPHRQRSRNARLLGRCEVEG